MWKGGNDVVMVFPYLSPGQGHPSLIKVTCYNPQSCSRSALLLPSPGQGHPSLAKIHVAPPKALVKVTPIPQALDKVTPSPGQGHTVMAFICGQGHAQLHISTCKVYVSTLYTPTLYSNYICT